MSKEKIIPDLRFPEFKNEGEWALLNGDNLFEPISNKYHKSNLPILAITQELGAVPRNMINYHVSVTDKSIESYKVVEVGDFIISLRSFQGGIEYSNYLGLCSPAYIILRKKIDLENDFYRHYFKSIPFISDLNRNIEGIRDGKMVSYKQFSEILIPFPKPKEQQKIATCLSSLDEVIAAHNQKLDVLKDHKKGLMQNLFPQLSESRIGTDDRMTQISDSKNKKIREISKSVKISDSEKVPKYRFKEFEKDGEWVEKTLDQICLVNPSSIELPNQFIYIDLESVENGILKKESKISLENAPSRAQRLLKNNDVIYQMVRPYQMNNYHFKINQEMSFVASTGYAQLRAKESSEFLFQLIHTKSFVNEVLIKCTGSNYPAINSSDLKAIAVKICKPKEQKKIASCLSSLDALITAQAEKIEQLKLHKKGLMQGLFPKINE